MKLRNATKADIPFIVDAILEIEKNGDSDTYSNLFGCDRKQTIKYLTNFLEDEESLDTEFSLNTYHIAEIDNKTAGCCCTFFTNQSYYQNKSELFPIHLLSEHLNNLIEKTKKITDSKKISEDKFFIDYIYTYPSFRGLGVAGFMIQSIKEKHKLHPLYLNVLENNTQAIQLYKKNGFTLIETVKIDTPKKEIFASENKLIMKKIN